MAYIRKKVHWTKHRDEGTGKVFQRGVNGNHMVEVRYGGRNDEGKRVLNVTFIPEGGVPIQLGQVLTMSDGRKLGKQAVKEYLANPKPQHAQPKQAVAKEEVKPAAKPRIPHIVLHEDDGFGGTTSTMRFVTCIDKDDEVEEIDSKTIRIPIGDADSVKLLSNWLNGCDRIAVHIRDHVASPFKKGWIHRGEFKVDREAGADHDGASSAIVHLPVPMTA